MGRGSTTFLYCVTSFKNVNQGIDILNINILRDLPLITYHNFWRYVMPSLPWVTTLYSIYTLCPSVTPNEPPTYITFINEEPHRIKDQVLKQMVDSYNLYFNSNDVTLWTWQYSWHLQASSILVLVPSKCAFVYKISIPFYRGYWLGHLALLLSPWVESIHFKYNFLNGPSPHKYCG
jgi:hypothetical protein